MCVFCAMVCLPLFVVGGLFLAFFLVLLFLFGFFGEFDPGSGRTLAACLTHASRTGLFSGFLVGGWVSGERVSNT